MTKGDIWICNHGHVESFVVLVVLGEGTQNMGTERDFYNEIRRTNLRHELSSSYYHEYYMDIS